MTIEVSKDDIVALLKGFTAWQSYENAIEVERRGAGKLSGSPRERWEWDERFFQMRSDAQLYEFYKYLKSLSN